METKAQETTKVREIVFIGIFAAFLAVLSQISIPMPGGVPVTMQIFAVALTGILLSSKYGALSVIIYLLVGMAGVPVFANFSGGIQVFAGASGGYLIAFPVMAALCGVTVRDLKGRSAFFMHLLFCLLGLFLCEAFGAFWWIWITKGDARAICLYALVTFVPKDVVSVVIALVLGRKIKALAGVRLPH